MIHGMHEQRSTVSIVRSVVRKLDLLINYELQQGRDAARNAASEKHNFNMGMPRETYQQDAEYAAKRVQALRKMREEFEDLMAGG